MCICSDMIIIKIMIFNFVDNELRLLFQVCKVKERVERDVRDFFEKYVEISKLCVKVVIEISKLYVQM